MMPAAYPKNVKVDLTRDDLKKLSRIVEEEHTSEPERDNVDERHAEAGWVQALDSAVSQDAYRL